jgi:uncharacterized protein YfiM (DUF2279 family)
MVLMQQFIRLLAFLLFLPLCAVFGQQHDPSLPARSDSSMVDKRKLRTVIAAKSLFYAGGIGYLHFVWYKDKERVPFHFYNDGRGYLQMDKFGHAFGAYAQSYAGYHLMRSAGVSRSKSLLWGGSLGFIMQTPIEIFDGLYEGWGFSWWDMAANGVGTALVIGQELAWQEQLIKMKFSFSPSPYRRQAHGYLGSTVLESLFLDYNAHTYWLSVPVQTLGGELPIPPWLSLAAGYSANGMFGEFENRRWYRGMPIPETERYRQYLISLDVDWTRIRSRNRFVQTLLKGMFFIKLPFPALEVNSKGGIKGYWLYY